MIYFDNAASTPLTARVREVMLEELSLWANPSSLHRLGFEAEKRLGVARRQVAAALSAAPEEIVFCSGGTEADNLALFGAAKKLRRRGKRILVSDSEHPAVSECMRALSEEGFEIVPLSTRGGCLSEEEIREKATPDTVLCAVMHTNNETGAVYDLPLVSRLVKEKNPEAIVFCDGVQGFLKTPLSPAAMGLDLMSVSSHKIHGPKGAGALWVRRGLNLPAVSFGGGQERGLRNGTENLPAYVAFGAACEEGKRELESRRARALAVKETIREGLRGDGRIRETLPTASSPFIMSLVVEGLPSEVLLHALSEREVFLSSGSACSSHKGRSPVLENFGLSRRDAEHTVRLSFSGLNTPEEGSAFCKILKEVLR